MKNTNTKLLIGIGLALAAAAVGFYLYKRSQKKAVDNTVKETTPAPDPQDEQDFLHLVDIFKTENPKDLAALRWILPIMEEFQSGKRRIAGQVGQMPKARAFYEAYNQAYNKDVTSDLHKAMYNAMEEIKSRRYGIEI